MKNNQYCGTRHSRSEQLLSDLSFRASQLSNTQRKWKSSLQTIKYTWMPLFSKDLNICTYYLMLPGHILPFRMCVFRWVAQAQAFSVTGSKGFFTPYTLIFPLSSPDPRIDSAWVERTMPLQHQSKGPIQAQDRRTGANSENSLFYTLGTWSWHPENRRIERRGHNDPLIYKSHP